MRGIAALFVVVHHGWLTVHPKLTEHTGVFDVLKLGHQGVVVFIVLSGMSLGIGVVSGHMRLRDTLGVYLRRRAWRIIPPYWIALVLSAAVTALFLSHPAGTHWDVVLPLSITGALGAALFANDLYAFRVPNHALWSVPIEMHLYFAVPVLLWLRRRAGFLAPLAASLAFASLAFSGAHVGPIEPSGYLFAFAASMAMGLAAAELYRNPQLWWRRRAMAVGAVAGIAGVALLAAGLHQGRPPVGRTAYLADILFSAGTAAALVRIAEARRIFLASPPFVQLGRRSYTLYLIHAPLLEVGWRTLVVHTSEAPTIRLLLMIGPVTALIVAIAWFAARYIELPFLEHRSLGELRNAAQERVAGTALPRGVLWRSRR